MQLMASGAGSWRNDKRLFTDAEAAQQPQVRVLPKMPLFIQ
jgi:hypothetical protein